MFWFVLGTGNGLLSFFLLLTVLYSDKHLCLALQVEAWFAVCRYHNVTCSNVMCDVMRLFTLHLAGTMFNSPNFGNKIQFSNTNIHGLYTNIHGCDVTIETHKR